MRFIFLIQSKLLRKQSYFKLERLFFLVAVVLRGLLQLNFTPHNKVGQNTLYFV